ncbi:MAG TPA: hypothetical protein VIG51_09010 [Candidatus Baltobacteraceae bacterium]
MNDARFDRRGFLAGGAALSATLLLPSSVRAQTLDASIVIDASHPMRRIPATFAGLSFEASLVGGGNHFTPDNDRLVAAVRALGQGVLHIGGSSVDHTVYGNADLRALAAFSRATNWPVLLGLNLRESNPQQTVGQAEDAAHALGNQLLAFEIGNEPDRYGSSDGSANSNAYRDYLSAYLKDAKGIASRVHGARFAGPGASARPSQWAVPFASDARSHLALLTQHYYRLGDPAAPDVTIERLLHGPDDARFESDLGALRDAAASARVPYRISQCAPASGNGKPGVGNTLASALWALDLCFRVASADGAGVNVRFVDTDVERAPLYYGLQLFARSANARLLPLRLGGSHPNLRAYAVARDDGSVLLTCINPDAIHAASVTVDGTGMTNATAANLTGPRLASTESVSITQSPLPLSGNPIEIAPASASLITLTR